MNKTIVKPCAKWADRLAARHPDDLSPADAAALKQHLQTCAVCASVYRSYALMESAIHALPVGEPSISLSQQSLLEEPVKRRLTDAITSEQISFPRWQRATRRRQRLIRFANLTAAVLVVGVIIVASLLIFGMHHLPTRTGGIKSTPPAQFYSGCDFTYDPGIQQACLDGYLIPIHQSKVISGYEITLDTGYIDSIRGVILFHVKKLSNGAYGYGQFLRAYPHNLLSTQQGTVLKTSYIENWLVSTPKGAAESAMYFYATDVPANAGELHLHLDIAVMLFFSLPPSRSTAVKGPVTFDFAVPFHAARRIANPHETLIINGKKVMLEQVMVGLSDTLLYLQGINYNTYHFSLLAGKWNRFLNPLGAVAPETDDTPILEADIPLLTETGSWALKITGNGGTWTFHFFVPPATGS